MMNSLCIQINITKIKSDVFIIQQVITQLKFQPIDFNAKALNCTSCKTVTIARALTKDKLYNTVISTPIPFFYMNATGNVSFVCCRSIFRER